jgi:hypothetical protein
LTPSTPPSPLTLAVSLFALSFALSFAAEASASAASKNDTVQAQHDLKEAFGYDKRNEHGARRDRRPSEGAV